MESKRRNERPRWRIWVDTQRKIVSFHEVPQFEVVAFALHEYFLNYIQSLSDSGYRFQ